MDKEGSLVITSLSTRVLIEFVATQIPAGSKWPNYDDIDELLALTKEIIMWGSISEAMRFGFDNPQIGLLPSGRISVDSTIV